MLLETMRIAASGWQRTMEWQGPEPGADTILVHFSLNDTICREPLFSFLTVRSVDRYAYRRRALTNTEKTALESSLGCSLVVRWHETLWRRLRLARIGALATSIRFRCLEAFAVHQRIIDWENPLSTEGIPARTLPLDRMTLRVMRWAMQSWKRANVLTRLGGTRLSAIQMDYVPILASSALFDVRLKAPKDMPADRRVMLLDAGHSLQRFWLTATKLGLAMQPLLAIVCMAHYGATRTRLTDPPLIAKSERLARLFDETIGGASSEVLFLGRVGEPYPRLPTRRSVRRPAAPAE
jgi:hypothetical protein